MNIHPQLRPFVAGATQFPKAQSIPIETFRQLVRQASTALPPLTLPIGKIEDRSIPGTGDGTEGGDIKVRIYTPVTGTPAPVLVYFHGGGFVVGDLDTQDMICRGLCHGAACVVVSVDYRLAPEHPFPAPLDDCWAAVRWAAAHMEELGGIPGCLAIGGDSAGATLSAGVALRARDEGGPSLCGQLLMYGAYSHPIDHLPSVQALPDAPFLDVKELGYYWRLYVPDLDKAPPSPYAMPALAESHADLPPAFIVMAETDPVRDAGEHYGLKLLAAGGMVQMRRYLGMLHGFVSWLGLVDGAQAAMDDACAWLKTRFAASTR